MIKQLKNIKLDAKISYILLVLNSIIFLALFFLIKIKIKPISYFLILIMIIVLTENVIAYFFKKELLFLRVTIAYNEKSVGNKFTRFLSLLLHTTVIVLLYMFVFANRLYFKIVSIVYKGKNAAGGGFNLIILICLLGAALFWFHYFIKKYITEKLNEKKRKG